MKLISCHIDAFGKFKNVDFKFTEQLNTFYEKNGFGKTTLAQFIKAMFYSLPACSKRNNYKSERDLYKPFDYDGKFGGSLRFSCRKGEFVVVRQFGSTPTLDKFYLFDAKTNLTSKEFSSNLGDELFGVGKETFENSTFFGQQDLVSGINDDIRASLSTGILSGDDVDNLQNAQDVIQKKVKEIKAEIKNLKLDEAQNDFERVKAKEEVLKIKLDKVEKEIADLTATQREVVSGNEVINEQEVASFVNRKVALMSVIDVDKARIDEKQVQKDALLKSSKISKDDYNFLKNNDNINKGQKAGNIRYALVFLAVLGAILVMCGGIIKINPLFIAGAIVTIASLVCIILSIFISRNTAEDLKRYHEILKTNKLTKGSLDAEIVNFKKVESEIENIEEQLRELDVDVQKNSLELGKIESQFKLKFGCEIDQYYLNKQLKAQSISSIDRKLIELNNDKKHYTEEMDNLQERIFEYGDSLEAGNEQLAELESKLNLLNRTSVFLNKSRDAISNRFIEPVSNRFKRYYSKFIDDGDEVVIDSNLNMRFGSSYNDVSYLSAGLFDLVYICKRFALVDLLFKKEKPALILDDPFANFDDDKLKVAKSLLNELKDDYQIVLFTCQKARG